MSTETPVKPAPSPAKATSFDTGQSRGRTIVDGLVRSILPVILALIVAGFIMLAMGSSPLDFFEGVWKYGLSGGNWQRSLVLMAPLVIIAVGLIVAFRGQLWNLGYNGQYLLGAVVASGLGPSLFATLPAWLATLIIFVGSILVGAVWSLIPAILKARYGTNEIITSLVMSFIGVGIANLLIKGPFKDPSTPQPQTAVIPDDQLLPYIPGTQIHIGFVIAIVLALVAQFVLTRTSFGLRMDVFGASPKAARHVGINSTWMVILLFAISSGLIAFAGSIDVLGQFSYQRANWDPHYGDAIMPFVFLARLSPLAAIPLVAFYAILATGGTLAAQQAGLNVDFLLVIVGLILLFMTITEYVGERRRLGQSYLPAGLRRTLVRPFQREGERPMSDMLSVTFVTVFVASVIAQTMPLLLASVGETIGEQAGVLNLGIEGVMLIGAYTGFVVTIATGSFWLGMLGGALGGVLGNVAMLVLNVWLGLNQIVIGLAVTLIGEGITSVLYLQNYAKTNASLGTAPSLPIPGLADIPVIGQAVFQQSGIFWAVILLVIVMGFLLAKTNWGLATRAAGQKPSSLDAAGGSVMRTRSLAVILSGAFVGLGGAYLSILTTSTFTGFLTNGLGFIAIVITMLSRGRIALVALSSLIYGIAVAIGPALQVIGFAIPADVIKMLPFIVVILTLIVFARSSVVPPALGAPYIRGAR